MDNMAQPRYCYTNIENLLPLTTVPKKSDSNKTSLSGGRWCVDKNFTHLELTDGMQAQLLTDLRDNRFCKSPLLGDSVGFVNFTENLQDAQYRAGGKIKRVGLSLKVGNSGNKEKPGK